MPIQLSDRDRSDNDLAQAAFRRLTTDGYRMREVLQSPRPEPKRRRRSVTLLINVVAVLATGAAVVEAQAAIPGLIQQIARPSGSVPEHSPGVLYVQRPAATTPALNPKHTSSPHPAKKATAAKHAQPAPVPHKVVPARKPTKPSHTHGKGSAKRHQG